MMKEFFFSPDSPFLFWYRFIYWWEWDFLVILGKRVASGCQQECRSSSRLYLSLYLPCEINNTQLKRRKLQPVDSLFSSPSVLLGCGERRKSSRKSPTSRKYWTKRLIALDCHCDLAGNIFDLVSHLSFRYRYIPVLLRTPPSIFT